MSTTIEITTRFCRVGNIIINRCEIANADTSTGNIVMKNGTKYNVPAKVAKHLFNDIPCSKELCGLFPEGGNHETIEDIVREMREGRKFIDDHAGESIDTILKVWAGRIEAAKEGGAK